MWDFALVNIAAAINASGTTIGDARMVVNGVAARPYRLEAVEAFLKGKARDEADGRPGGRDRRAGRRAAAAQRLQDAADEGAREARDSRRR